MSGAMGRPDGDRGDGVGGDAVRADGDRGQVSVELLGMTPLILLTLVLMWQAVLVGYTFTLAGNAADEAVRAATAAPRGGARQAACAEAGLKHLSGAWRGTRRCGAAPPATSRPTSPSGSRSSSRA